MTVSGERAPAAMTAAPLATASAGSAASAMRARATRPPWWCAHRSRSSAVGVLVTAVFVCLAAAVAVVGFASTGSTVGALVALGALAIGAANVISGSFGAAWWARRAPRTPGVTFMNTTDDRQLRRPAPVVPAARESRGRHAADPVDEPTTRIPTRPGHPLPPPHQPPPGPHRPRQQGMAPVPTVGPPPPAPAPTGGPTDPTEALPIQQPGEFVGDDERPGPATTRAAARRAAARPSSKIKRVAGRGR